jgi:prepilin-type N-terminal cleavage/methylation domain-containing protein
MVRERIRRLAPGAASRGFSAAELIVVVAIVGTLTAIGMPTFLSYWKGSTLRAGTQEVTALLNSGRQLAIKENQSVCVKGDVTAATYGTRLRFTVGSCQPSSSTTYCNPAGGTTTDCVWRGAGTDGAGYVELANRVQVMAPATDVRFTYLGAAAAGGSFLVCNPAGSTTRARVTVAPSGRISTAYENAPC